MTAQRIARQLEAGEISSKHEATRRLVAGILRDRMRFRSPSLIARICEQLEEDPQLRRTLERLWG